MILFSLLIVIASFLFYLYAPDVYSHQYVIYVCLLFLLMSFVFLKNVLRRFSYLNFHFLFLLSFFFTNFVYPVFIYPINPIYFTVFTFKFDHNVISKTTALAQLAISLYVFGVSFLLKKMDEKKKKEKIYNFNPLVIRLVNFFSIATSFYYLFVVLKTAYTTNEEVIDTQVVNVVVVLFAISMLLHTLDNRSMVKDSFKSFVSCNKLGIIGAIIVVGSSLWFGDRGPAMQIAFILLIFYVSFVRPLKITYVLVLVVVGFYSMTLISYTRQGETSLRKGGSLSKTFDDGMSQVLEFDTFWEVGMDLIVNSRNLYVAYDYVKYEDYLYGRTYFPYLFVAIPGLPAYLSTELLGKTPEELSTGRIISDLSGIYSWGLGTNAVGDIYMNFGLIGTVLLFFLFGLIVARLELSDNLYSILAYVLIFSFAIYYPRASILIVLSLVFRAIMLLFLLLLLFNKRKNRHYENTIIKQCGSNKRQ